MPKLHEISKDFNAIQDEEMSAEEMRDCLDSIECAFEEKANNILAFTTGLDSDVKAIDEEIKRLQARKKAMINRSDSFKEYLRNNMEATGITKITHPLFSVTLGKPTKKAVVFDSDLIPDEYINVKTELKPDLKLILKDLKEGVEISGAKIEEGKSRLLIK
jgi:uncharacterized protein YeeX (DUF496 family)